MTETTVLTSTSLSRLSNGSKVVPFPLPPKPTVPAGATELSDDRYRNLLGEARWRALPHDVRRRFSKHLAAGAATIYRGEVVATELSRAGWLLAQLARLVGGPLPYIADATGPAVVTVTEEPALHGQIWSRQYARPGRFPQVIHSAKRFTGPTGLEEYLGLGLVMRLAVSVENATLVFRSHGYAIEIGRLALAVPRWLCPGDCEIRHRAETDGRFSFELTLAHPVLGPLIHQVAFFHDGDALN